MEGRQRNLIRVEINFGLGVFVIDDTSAARVEYFDIVFSKGNPPGKLIAVELLERLGRCVTYCLAMAHFYQTDLSSELHKIIGDLLGLLVEFRAGHRQDGNPCFAGATGKRDELFLYVSGGISSPDNDQLAFRI